MKAILLLADQHLAKTWPRPIPLGNSILAWSMIHGYYGQNIVDYESSALVVLAVDTSWKAIGFYLYQQDPEDPKKKYYARFESITLNEREVRFSQPKRELFGLMRALEEMQYWLIGC